MQKWKAYLPVLIWMSVIFVASTDLGSTRRTSRFIGPFLRWFNPEISAETIHDVQVVVRKCGHITEYAVLAILVWIARRVSRAVRPLLSQWQWMEARWIVLFCGLYAVTDEIHQTFVSTRQGNPWDVLLDSFGATCGLLAVWIVGRWRKRW
jgi:VanZ family protein